MDTIFRANGKVEEAKPKNGTGYQLDELKEIIGGGWIQIIPLGPKQVMVMDEEGKFKAFDINKKSDCCGKAVSIRWGLYSG